MRILLKFIKNQKACPEPGQRGATLIELLVAIFLILAMIVVFVISFRAIVLNQEIKTRAQAHFLALGETEAIRKIPFAELTNRTNANFINVIYNLGLAEAKADSSAPSLPNVFNLSPASTPINNLTSLAIIPGNDCGDFTFEVMTKVLNTSPSGWQAGFIFRAKDIDNHYRFIFNSSLIKLEKITNSAPSTLYSINQTFNLNNWYKLKVIASGTSISLYLNNNLLSTITDSSLAGGKIGLAGLNSAQMHFDDVSVTASSTTTWNFDNDTEGKTASGWEKFGINDLPSGQAQLTIEDYNETSNLKKITVKVSWTQKQKIKSVNLITVSGQYGFNP